MVSMVDMRHIKNNKMFWDGVRITKSNITEENTVERVIFIYFALRHLQIYPETDQNIIFPKQYFFFKCAISKS